MPEARRRFAPEQARQPNLASGGRQQILAANHVGDALQVIVDGHGVLIGPVAEAIAHQQIAALLARILFLRPEDFVEEALGTRLDDHAPADVAAEGDALVAAGVRITNFRSLIPTPRSLT